MTSEPKPNLADIKRTHSDGERCKSAHCDVPALIRAFEAVIEPHRPVVHSTGSTFCERCADLHSWHSGDWVEWPCPFIERINQHLTIGDAE